MKIYNTIIAALLLFLPVVSHAATTQAFTYGATNAAEPTHFILCLNNGEQITFVLEHNPKVVNGDGFITVVDEGVTIEYPLENVHKYLMGVDKSTGIDNIFVSSDKNDGNIANRAGDIILSGFNSAVPVIICDINGMVVYESTTNVDGYLVISTSQYPLGIYIVKVQNKTFKFIKR